MFEMDLVLSGNGVVGETCCIALAMLSLAQMIMTLWKNLVRIDFPFSTQSDAALTTLNGTLWKNLVRIDF